MAFNELFESYRSSKRMRVRRKGSTEEVLLRNRKKFRITHRFLPQIVVNQRLRLVILFRTELAVDVRRWMRSDAVGVDDVLAVRTKAE